MNHAMIDIESWGTTPGSAIRSIGAVMFDPSGGGLGAEFYGNVDDGSCLDAGLTQDANTIAWWARQNAAAQAAFDDTMKTSLNNVLWSFSCWWQREAAEFVWSHGANFDQPLVEAAYRAIGMKAPWSFWNSRCTRTAYDLARIDTRKMQSGEIKHHALHDAKAQARAVQLAYRRIFNLPEPAAEDFFA